MESVQPNFVEGFDYSRWQGFIDWASLKGKIAFAFGKATEGMSITDPMFSVNYTQAKRVGIARGAYHYLKPNEGDFAGQAEHYVQTVKKAGGFDGLPPMLDVEEIGTISKAALTQGIRTFANAVKLATGRSVLLYTNLWFAGTYLDASLSNEFTLFLADYGVKQPPNVLNWTKWLFLQETDKGKLPGISGYVDLDVFDGSTTDFQSFLGEVKPTMPTQKVDFSRVVTADLLNIRAGAGTTFPVRYQAKKGQVLHVTEITGDWAYTTYGALGGYTNTKYLAALPPIQPVAPPTPSEHLVTLGKLLSEAQSLLEAIQKEVK